MAYARTCAIGHFVLAMALRFNIDCKKVLVSYIERNIAFEIPSDVELELDFLEKQFRKELKFGNNVNIDVRFQRFDPEWDDFVELSKGSTLEHKEKLKAVVSPSLVTPSHTATGSSVNSEVSPF